MNGNKKIKKTNYSPKSRLRCRLSFDEGYAERPLYSIKAFTNEKEKGINMIDLIQDNFDINSMDIKEFHEDKFNLLNNDFKNLKNIPRTLNKSLKLTRDEQGNLMSPFGNKAKELAKLAKKKLNKR